MDARSCTETFALTRLRLRAAGSRASVRTWRIVAQLHRLACNAQHGARIMQHGEVVCRCRPGASSRSCTESSA